MEGFAAVLWNLIKTTSQMVGKTLTNFSARVTVSKETV